MTRADLLEPILEQLAQVRARCPELRFGQLIATIAMLAGDETGHSLWDVEDGDFAAALERFAADMAHRPPYRAGPAPVPDRGGVKSSPDSTVPQPPRQVG
jgi:hypothetical protein